MKPPYGNKPGGSGRPPSRQGAKPGGGASHNRGPNSRGANTGGPASAGANTRGPGSSNRLGLGGVQPDSRGPRPEGAKPHGSKPYSPRPQGAAPRDAAPRDATSRQATSHGGKPFQKRAEAPRHDFPQRDVQAPGRGAYIDGQRHDPRPPARGPDTPKGSVWLYGYHAVAAALANPRRLLRRLILTEEAEANLAQTLPSPWALQPERTDRARIDQLLGRDIAHQGVALLADTLPQPSLAEVLERSGPIIVLDQVTDPRNVGAIMRCAAAFGAAAVITQDRNAPEETGSLAKAASGTLETLPLLRAVNIARTLIALKAANVWCVGLDASGKPLSGPFFAGRRIALVLGAEGDGMRRLTRETCDEVAGLAIKGAVESLNVSAAAAVALYELKRTA